MPENLVTDPSHQATKRKPLVYYGYWITMAAFFAQLVSIGTQNGVTSTMLDSMSSEFGWERSQFLLGQTGSRITMALVGFIIGGWIDKWGGRPLMVVGVTIVGVSMILTSAIRDITFLGREISPLTQWLILRSLAFTVGAAMIGNLVVNVTLAKWWVEKRGLMVACAATGVSLAGVIYPLLTAIIIETWSWREAWQVHAVVAWIIVYAAAMVMRRQPEDYGLNPDNRTAQEMLEPSGSRVRADFNNSFTRGEALRTPSLYLLVVTFGTAGVGISVALSLLVPLATDAGFSLMVAASLTAVMSLWAALSKPFWGYTIDRFDPKKLACLGFTVAGIGFLVVAFASQMPDQPTVRYPIEFWKFRGELPLILLLGCTLIGVGFGGQIPLQETIWGSFFGRRYLGAVRSVGMPFSILFGAVAVPGAAYWAEVRGGLDAPFIATAICWFVGAVLVLFIPKPSKNIETPDTKASIVNPNANILESEDTNSESILSEGESHISISNPTHPSRLSERNHKHKNYMRTKD